MLGQWLSYQDHNQATMVFCTKAPLSSPCWNRLSCKGRPLMEQHIIVGMEFKLMLCQTESKVFWAGRIAYRYVERAGRAPMNAGEAGPSVQTGREICQPIPDNHVFYAALSCQWHPQHKLSGQRQACSSLARELHIVDHVAHPPPCCNDNSATASSHSAAPPAKRKSTLHS